MKNKVVFWTHAYNAEKTIAKTIESILNQTLGGFTYYCLDNGSKDSTNTIIREYAARDARIIPLYRPKNIICGIMHYLPLILSQGDDGYLAVIDADDEYAPEFLKKMTNFANENALDYAMCGTEYVNTDGTSRLDTPPKTLIFQGAGFSEHLPAYYKYATRLWGGLISIKMLAKTNIEAYSPPPTANFADVKIALKLLGYATRGGLLAESLHKYYASPDQLSSSYTPDWFSMINELQEMLRAFILNYGPISKKNEDYLHLRFLILLKYILPRLQNAEAPLKMRLQDLFTIFTDKKVKNFLSLDWKATGILTDKLVFLQENLDWAVKEIPKTDDEATKSVANMFIYQLSNMI